MPTTPTITDTQVLQAIPVPDGATSWQIARAVGVTPEMDERGRAAVQRRLQGLKKAGLVELDVKKVMWRRKRDHAGNIIGRTERAPATYPPRSGRVLAMEKASREQLERARDEKARAELARLQEETGGDRALERLRGILAPAGEPGLEGVRLYAVYLKPDQRHPDALFYRRYEAHDWLLRQVDPLQAQEGTGRIVRVLANHTPLDMGGTSR